MKREKYFNGKSLKASDLTREQNYQTRKNQEKENKAMPASSRKDPHRNFNFLVEIDGITIANFMECSGLESETEVLEYREGGEPNVVRKLPGLTFYTNILLMRGVSDSKELYEWRKNVINGQIARKNGSIVLLNEKREEVARWNFREGWPCRMSGPDLSALESDVAIEEIEICHEGFERV